MVAQGFRVDLNKPLVFQVGHLGEDYQEWVHQPIASKEGPRFFESNFWEWLYSYIYLLDYKSTECIPLQNMAAAASAASLFQSALIVIPCESARETPCIIFFMVAIISTPWMGSAWFSLLLQQLFYVFRYLSLNHGLSCF
ncbi:hypothetical protein RHMOL_Rhmol02G0208000 [Rhododendron molle]|uniref:Uncharacterized protein n=1 Tax=Rhododendron molle TaxID=49168 RepID=A0ACC0PSR8_RHOML|nr:hypothetical protein RHMOL_Rhmol02G0208000 [Rhododendron molle]